MTMREKMARAMFDAGAKRMNSKKTWDTCEQSYRDLMFAEVDAALDALMNPTDAMIDAGMNVGMIPACYGEVEAHWKAMIGAAKEGK